LLLRLDSLTRRFGDTVAVDAISLDVAEGEFLTLVSVTAGYLVWRAFTRGERRAGRGAAEDVGAAFEMR